MIKLVAINEVLKEKISGEWGVDAEKGPETKVIRTANFLNNGKINFKNIVMRNIPKAKVEKKKLIDGDVIIEKSGGSPIQPVGRVVYFMNPDSATYLCNNFTSILRPDPKMITGKYLFYALFYNHKTSKTLSFQNKTTGIINLKLESYLQTKILLPPLEDQIRIAKVLGRLEGFIARRKESLRLLDEFLKSTFLEMFGDPIRNQKGWKVKKLIEVVSLASGGTPSKTNQGYWQGKIPWVSPKDMKTLFISDSIDHISAEAATQLKMIPVNSILVVVRGLILVHHIPFALTRVAITINQDMKALQLKNEDYDPIFLLFFLIISENNLLKKVSTAAHGTKRLDTTNLENFLVIFPPFLLQRKFSEIARKVEELKASYLKNLEELEALFGSLSQLAFKGELDVSNVPLEENEMIPSEIHVEAADTTEKEIIKADFSEAAILAALRKSESKTLSFGSLFIKLQNDETAEIADYEKTKQTIFSLLRKKILSQSFDENKKEMVLNLEK
ncbi:MAG: restriction endonuclease subunit S [Candidatus Ozemobacteraceae bacterium]